MKEKLVLLLVYLFCTGQEPACLFGVAMTALQWQSALMTEECEVSFLSPEVVARKYFLRKERKLENFLYCPLWKRLFYLLKQNGLGAILNKIF